ncbi:MAG: glycosyltransferase family 39 protein [Leptolyngbyaceae cyanobacterium MO_188.B28]|nr:glycosyltransferase family 39 protein [Leptolyngbyaceae cyanobacterium MO_188.B28]
MTVKTTEGRDPKKSFNGEPQKEYRHLFWLAFALLVISIVSVAAIFWIFAHPYGVNWDEAHYINRLYRDVNKFQTGGWTELIRILFQEDVARPPALRLFVLPLTLPLGVTPFFARLISLGFLGITLGVIFQATQQISDHSAGAFAAICLGVSPIIVAVSMRFYMEYALYFCVAVMMYFLFRDWGQPKTSTLSWIGLGVAMGFGMLTKVSFAFVAAPVWFGACFFSWRKQASLNLDALVKAAVVALVVLTPWWAVNFRAALSYALFAGSYVDHSLGPLNSPLTWGKWLTVFYQTVTGPALFWLIAAILGTALVKRFRQQLSLSPAQQTALWLCWIGALASPTLSFFGSNHNPRLITPSLLPFAIAVGVLASVTGWTRQRWLSAIAAGSITFQCLVLVSPSPGAPLYKVGDHASKNLLWGNPTSVMRRQDLWDWSQLKSLCDTHGLTNPNIAYLGDGGELSPTQIQFPWVIAGKAIKVEALWRSASRSISVEDLIRSAADKDVIITAPDWEQGKNPYNSEFARVAPQLLSDWTETELILGDIKPTRILVLLHVKNA